MTQATARDQQTAGHRVRTEPNYRRVRVCYDGETVADSIRPRLLFETGLPVRYYLPKVGVRQERPQTPWS
ncbi:MAG: DUF427 domain-containing protein [Streptosporangiaceae bacterium]